jgi:hypothetical protein
MTSEFRKGAFSRSGKVEEGNETMGMGKTKAELREALLRTVEAEIDQLLNWEDDTGEVTMTEIEDQVLAARQRISTQLTQVLAQRRAERADLTIPTNADGKRLHYKGKKTKSARPALGS